MNSTTQELAMPSYLCEVIADGHHIGVRHVPGQGWCGLQQFNFTWGLVVNLTPDGYERRYCYEHLAEASRALDLWDGRGHPSGPWIKCKGAGIDLLNPSLELI